MGIRFRIANFIMKDYLRNYLAVGIRLPLKNLIRYKEQCNLDSFTIQTIEKCIETINDIFEI